MTTGNIQDVRIVLSSAFLMRAWNRQWLHYRKEPFNVLLRTELRTVSIRYALHKVVACATIEMYKTSDFNLRDPYCEYESSKYE